jgi:dihydroorotase
MACETPAKLFGFGKRGKIIPGHTADFVVLSTKALAVNNQDVISKCGWTPYDQMTLPRGVLQTWWAGKRVWQA